MVYLFVILLALGVAFLTVVLMRMADQKKIESQRKIDRQPPRIKPKK